MDQTATQGLPGFRRDLKIYRGPHDIDGSPTYNIHDPVKGQYYKLSWKESLVFKCMKHGMKAEDLAETINRCFPVEISTEDIKTFFGQAAFLGLLQMPRGGDYLYQAKAKTEQSLWTWLLVHYLFIRFPLINPDRFLGKTLKYVEFLGSRLAFIFYAVVVFIGFTFLVQRFEQFWGTFNYFFNLQGLIFYACAISLVKVIHEFSHAYVGKHFGLYVPSMGLAFLVLWPVLFTDVTDSWKLANRRERFIISFAGITSELVIAGLSLIGWVLLEPGIWKSIFFVLASTSLFSTLMVNMNPAIRFDGYYILSDVWGIDNLFSRAFAVTRWKFHQTVFGLDLEPPEENLSFKRTLGFIVFGVYVVIYRIFLYTTIALFVYYKFTKILGIFLFLVEILVFFLWPVWWEMKNLYQIRDQLKANRRIVFVFAALTLLGCWVVLPLPHKMGFDGVIIPDERQIVYVPEGAMIKQISVRRDQRVSAGSPVIELVSRKLLKDIADNIYDKQVLEKEIRILSQEEADEQYLSQKDAELSSVEEQYQGLVQREKQLSVTSEITGKITEWDESLREGQYISKGAAVGIIVDPKSLVVVTYVNENDIDMFKIGQTVEVVIRDPLMFLQGKVDSIHQARSSKLIYPALASVYQGPLPVIPDPRRQSLALVGSYYVVTLSVDPEKRDLLRYGQSLEVRMRGPWRSHLVSFVKAVLRVLLRESSF